MDHLYRTMGSWTTGLAPYGPSVYQPSSEGLRRPCSVHRHVGWDVGLESTKNSGVLIGSKCQSEGANERQDSLFLEMRNFFLKGRGDEGRGLTAGPPQSHDPALRWYSWDLMLIGRRRLGGPFWKILVTWCVAKIGQ